jgi:hypothetical protein
MGEEMIRGHQRLLAAAALVFTMSGIVALVVISPLVWRDGSNPEPTAEAISAQDEVAEVVAAPKPAQPAARAPDRREVTSPAGSQRGTSEASPSGSPRPEQARPLNQPAAATPPAAVVDKKGKAKGHEKKALGSKKTGKHEHHAQGTAGKAHGKGKGKDRDRAAARARG